MTEEDVDFLHDLKERFWLEFSELCNRYIAEATARGLTDEATMMLGEKTSIYGRREPE